MSQSTDYAKYLGDFYYGGTLILQCIKQLATIRNWVTFCEYGAVQLYNNFTNSIKLSLMGS